MKASIIVTSYNYGRYLERCLRSCVSQNFKRNAYEVIVVDDASTDETPEILKKFSVYENFRAIVNETNLGVAAAANAGVDACFGRYFVRVDADDYVNENLLLFMVSYLEENHDAFCVSCDYYYVDEFGNRLERNYAEETPISCGILYRTDVFRQLGMYNDEFRHREEEELRKRLEAYYRIHHLRMPLYRYRKHGANKTSNQDEMERFRERLHESYPETESLKK